MNNEELGMKNGERRTENWELRIMAIMHPKLLEVAAKDPRYTYEAYDFIFKALEHADTLLDRPGAEPIGEPGRHFKSSELLEGIRALALREFGLMARTVFRMWGVRATEDFGHIIFNLVEAGLISKTDDETLADFQDGFDFEEALVRGYKIQLDEAR
jgi:uncharacterized repeat protein (TIGR04138 family)